MIIDAHNQFCSAQAVTAAAASTNILDLGAIRGMGIGENLYVVLTVATALTDSGSDSTVDVDLETDDNSGFSSPVASQRLFTVAAVAAAGTKYVARISPGAANERYARLKFTPNNGNLTTGAFTAEIVHDVDEFVAYAKGYTIS